jgi:hypothetical protein
MVVQFLIIYIYIYIQILRICVVAIIWVFFIVPDFQKSFSPSKFMAVYWMFALQLSNDKVGDHNKELWLHNSASLE